MDSRLGIGEPLAFDALKEFGGTRGVINAELDAVAVAEIELGEIAVQVSLADRMVGSVDPAL